MAYTPPEISSVNFVLPADYSPPNIGAIAFSGASEIVNGNVVAPSITISGVATNPIVCAGSITAPSITIGGTAYPGVLGRIKPKTPKISGDATNPIVALGSIRAISPAVANGNICIGTASISGQAFSTVEVSGGITARAKISGVADNPKAQEIIRFHRYAS